MNILIDYKPELYRDLFGRLFEQLGEVNILCNQSLEKANARGGIDVVVLSVDKEGQPDLTALAGLSVDAMLVAFAPSGKLGLLRRPGEAGWNEIRPFGVGDLVQTVLGDKVNGKDNGVARKS